MDVAVAQITTRSADVLERINAIKISIVDQSLELGRLLKEVKENCLHHDYGYARFADWLEKASGLDISVRQSYYLIAVTEKVAEYNIPDDQLRRIGISKLKEILSLPAEVAKEDVVKLLSEAEDTPLLTVREIVGVLRNTETMVIHLKITRDDNDQLFEPAIERARREHGGFSDNKNGSLDISTSQAVCLIMADYLGNPTEIEDWGTLEGEFEDVVEKGE